MKKIYISIFLISAFLLSCFGAFAKNDIYSVAEKDNFEFERKLNELNAKLRERIAQLLGKYAEMEAASNAENALETAC